VRTLQKVVYYNIWETVPDQDVTTYR